MNESPADLRRQRDEARQQRDRAKAERDEARRQRDTARQAEAAPAFTQLDAFAAEAARAEALPSLQARHLAGETLRAQEQELLAPRFRPALLRYPIDTAPPPAGLALACVADRAFLPGLEALLLSLRHTYPGLGNPFHLFTDASIDALAEAWLRRLYPAITVHRRSLDAYADVPLASTNQKRIGPIAYLGGAALGLVGTDRVLLLDADLLVTGGLAPLWQGGDTIACADCGEREFAVRSAVTGRAVLNSGVLSLPGRLTGEAALAEWQALAQRGTPSCPVLDRFADQRVWNHFLAGRAVRLAPVNLNCNAKYAARMLGGRREALSVLHFTGPKPWLLPAGRNETAVDRWWSDAHRTLLWRHRHAAFAAIEAARPAIGGTGWFGSAPPPRALRFAAASAMPQADEPPAAHMLLDIPTGAGPATLPLGWATALRALRPRPVLWAPFRLRDALEQEGLPAEFEIRCLLLEDPFAPALDAEGDWGCPAGFLAQASTVALTLAAAAAQALGLQRLVVAGPLPAEARAAFAWRRLGEALHAAGVELAVGD